MNIDRPLEEIILEKRKEQRRTTVKKRRPRKSQNGSVGTKATPDKDATGDVNMMDVVTKRRPTKSIKKKRRSSSGVKTKLAKSKEVQVANSILDQAIKSFHEQTGTKPAKSVGTSGVAAGSAGTKVTVTNLDPGVTNIDVSELFGAVGPLKRALVVYDKNGRSTGIAEVIFENSNDALEAIKKYNGVPLDNRPLQISLATAERGAKGRTGAVGGAGVAKVPQQGGGFWGGRQGPGVNGSFGGGAEHNAVASNPFNAPLPDSGPDLENRNAGSRGGRRGRRRYRGRNRNIRDDSMMQD